MKKRVTYAVEVKEATIKMKLEGKTTCEIMAKVVKNSVPIMFGFFCF
ncbi:hypothetical protein [Vagococcus fessus]|nr:hypothetical protein [Vagococcus fessus]